MSEKEQSSALPSSRQIRKAIKLYKQRAYANQWPGAAEALLPPRKFDPAVYLMSESAERTPQGAKLPEVRSFALRLGNALYRHMKLRISRVPNHNTYLFSVDSHDAFLRAAVGSPEKSALDELKRHNAQVSAAILTDWDSAGLPTERSFLRGKIKEAQKIRSHQ